jgi:protein tyrosine phosphatase (PTP) superfamily phosphohydrolase (DUF442 family)
MEKIYKNPVLLFLAYFLFVGFPTGLFTLLMGPTKWVIQISQYYRFPDNVEDILQKVVIVLFVVISFFIAWWLHKKHAGFKSNFLRWGVFSFFALNFLFAVYMFSYHPEKLIALADSAESEIIGQHVEFVFGPYPDEDKLKELKANGYTAVITLMSDLVVPAEPKLIKEEKVSTARVGITFIHIPMLPWISGNENAMKQIDSIATYGRGKYYVHCYLGRDRVNVFKHIVEDQGVRTKMELKASTTRRLEDIPKFERGSNFKLDSAIYLTPLPTEEEFFGYVCGGQFKTVVCLLDPSNLDDKKWIDKEMAMLEQYDLPMINIPLGSDASDEQIKDLLKQVLKLPRPILIHAFKSDTPLCDKLRKAFGKK